MIQSARPYRVELVLLSVAFAAFAFFGTPVVSAHAVTVVFHDANFERTIRGYLGIPSGDVTDVDMLRLTEVSLVCGEDCCETVRDLTGLEYATNLTEFTMYDEGVSDLRPLSGLTSLKVLRFDHCHRIVDLSPLAGLTNLESATITECGVDDVAALAGMTKLAFLDISFGRVTDITPLAHLANLKTLLAGTNRLKTLPSMSGMKSLERLDLMDNPITSIAGLVGLSNLKRVELEYDHLTSIAAIARLPKLERVRVDYNYLDLRSCSPAMRTIAAWKQRGVSVTYRPQAAYISTPIAPATMSHARYYTVYGYLKPKHTAGQPCARIYKWKKTSAGRWVSCGYVIALASNYSDYSKYSRRIRLSLKGTWRLRARAVESSAHQEAWSSGYEYVTVK